MITILVSLGYAAVTFLVGVITVAVVYARWHYGTLERVKGLPVVITPAFIGGSDPYVYKKIVHDQDSENVKKYGKVYGVSWIRKSRTFGKATISIVEFGL